MSPEDPTGTGSALMTRLQKLQGHVDELLSAFIGLRLNYSLLKPILGEPNDGVPHPPPKTHYSGLPAIRTVLFRSCVLDLVKLAWDADRRTPSAAGLVEALKDTDVVESVLELHGSPRINEEGLTEKERRHQARIRESNAEVRRSRVRQQIVELKALWSQLDGAHFKEDFLTMRDKHIAHLEVRLEGTEYVPLDVTSLSVRRRDLHTAVTEMGRIVWLLNAVLRDSDFMMDRAVEQFDSQAQQFWGALVPGDASFPT